MTVSIALCTFNGEKFLKEQLESFTHQTKLPDELIICDDHSTDTTLQIVESFIQSAPFNVRLYVNESRMGSTKNFERAISLSKGDVIFLSDQDDWWHPEKINTILDCFSPQGKYGGVFSDAEIVDETLNYQNRNLWESIGFDKIHAGILLEVIPSQCSLNTILLPGRQWRSMRTLRTSFSRFLKSGFMMHGFPCYSLSLLIFV